MPANLNRKQQREIKAVVERAKKDNGIPQTAQQSIPFQRMFPDGICRVTDSYYTKTIQFQDINYQLAQQEDKTAIFDEWCSFLNFFDSSIHFELSFMNLSTDAESFEKSIRIPFKKDSFNPVRAEYRPEGLLFYGNVILPFIDRFPTDLELYRIMTTKLNEVAQEKEA